MERSPITVDVKEGKVTLTPLTGPVELDPEEAFDLADRIMRKAEHILEHAD